jgi:hypothetical protein
VTPWVPAAGIDACGDENVPRDSTDSAESLVFAASMKGSGSVTINVELP